MCFICFLIVFIEILASRPPSAVFLLTERVVYQKFYPRLNFH